MTLQHQAQVRQTDRQDTWIHFIILNESQNKTHTPTYCTIFLLLLLLSLFSMCDKRNNQPIINKYTLWQVDNDHDHDDHHHKIFRGDNLMVEKK